MTDPVQIMRFILLKSLRCHSAHHSRY